MRRLSPVFDARQVEAGARAIWAARSLPTPPSAELRPGGTPVRFVAGPVPRGGLRLATALQLARVDAEDRTLRRTGVRPTGSLRPALRSPAPADGPTSDVPFQMGVWFGGGRLAEAEAGGAARGAMLERLAADGLLVARSGPVRVCPLCRLPRSPQSVIHQPEVGSAYLVRFPIRGSEPATSLLVWVDSPWMLLATAAILVHPTLPYALVRCRQGEREERLVLLRSAVDSLRQELPNAQV